MIFGNCTSLIFFPVFLTIGDFIDSLKKSPAGLFFLSYIFFITAGKVKDGPLSPTYFSSVSVSPVTAISK